MTDAHQSRGEANTSSTDDARNPVDELADEFVERLRRGEYPSVTEYANRHPELAEEIRDVLPTLAMLEKCGGDDFGDAAGAAKADDTPDRLGGYRIIREVARGGMGVVYEAEHDTMGRRVALKVLPAQMAARGAHLQRFHCESRAAGRLHHTNIVPVFEVGTDQGYHFYAMQFIHGQSLDLIIDELKLLQDETGGGRISDTIEFSANDSLNRSVAKSLKSGAFQNGVFSTGEHAWADEPAASAPGPANERLRPVVGKSAPADSGSVSESFRSGKPLALPVEAVDTSSARYGYFHRVARVGLQVADALAYAHGQRVLHRDIKPANIILDTAGVSWVTDFGLAKNEDGALTQTGDIVGTFRYMAPERFEGDADARCDVYGLGLTLYELCTLRPAFSETDRVRLIKSITTQDPLRPRRINAQIPRDLETIILKAIERQPGRRYGTAKELASDLRRFLSDRPIAARRSSVIEQTWRLCRRNPLPSILLTCMMALLALIVAGSVRFGYLSQQQADQLREENVRALAAEQEALNANMLAAEHLYELSVGRAESGRFSGRLGQNYATMESISKAVSLLPELDISATERQAEKLKLRNLAIAAMSLVDLRGGQEWEVGPSLAITVDSENELLAQGDGDGNIKLRRLDGKGPRTLLASPSPPARWIRFSDDGSFLLAKHHGGNPFAGHLAIWNLRTSMLQFTVKEDMARSAVAIAPSGQEAALGRRRGAIDIISLADGAVTMSIPTGFDPTHIAFDSTGSRLVCATQRKIQIWQLGSQVPSTELELPTTVSSLAWNSHHSILAAGSMGGHLMVWHDAEFQLPPWQLEPHRGSAVVELAIHPEGELLISRGWDDFVRVNDLTTQQQVLRIDRGSIMNCGFNRDGTEIAYTRKQHVGIWRLAKRPLAILRSNSDDWRGETSFHPSQRRLLVSPVRNEVELWDVQRRALIGVIPSRKAYCRFTPDGSAILTAGASGIRSWPIALSETSEHDLEVAVGKSTRVYDGPSKRFRFDETGRYIALAADSRYIMVVDLEDEAAALRIGPHDSLDRVAITPEGRLVVTSTWQGWAVRVWDRETGEPLKVLGPYWRSASIAVSPDGGCLLAASGSSFTAWDTTSWQPIWQHDRNNPSSWPGSVAFLNQGRYVACCLSRYVPQLCDAKTGAPFAVLEAPKTEQVGEFSMSADGGLLAIDNWSNIHIWNLHALRDRLSELDLSWDP